MKLNGTFPDEAAEAVDAVVGIWGAGRLRAALAFPVRAFAYWLSDQTLMSEQGKASDVCSGL